MTFDQWLQTEAHPHLRDAGPLGTEWIRKIYEAGQRNALPAQAEQRGEVAEMSPEFTDTSRDALLWVLWHHQGASSPVGQPIRFALGMGAHDRLSEIHLAQAKRWASLTKSTTEEFHAPPAPVVPDGWRPVPVEPTPAMVAAVLALEDKQTVRAPNPDGLDRWSERDVNIGPVWAAMLAAAPEVPRG